MLVAAAVQAEGRPAAEGYSLERAPIAPVLGVPNIGVN